MEENRMFPENGNMVIGVSGGPDSVCLLWLLCALRESHPQDLQVVHVDHGLRQESKEDALFVQKLCEEWGVPCRVVRADVAGVAAERKISKEEAGRLIRYEAFEKALGEMDEKDGGCGCVAVAHNRDDRAETLLFHLFRGTGLKGMGSIRPVRGSIIRPLLDTGREEIEEWLKKNGISWRTDATNESDDYTRNRIRRRVIPYVEEEICGEAGLHLARAAGLLAQVSDYMDGQARARLKDCLVFYEDDAAGLDVQAFLASDELLQTLMLKALMEELSEGGRDIGQRHILDVQALFTKQSGRMLTLPGGLEARREFGQVIINRRADAAGELPVAHGEKAPAGCVRETETDLLKEVRETGSAALEIPGMGMLEITLLNREKSQGIEQKAYTKWLDYDRIKTLVLRTRRPGDYLAINDRLQKKSLKEYLIQERVPAGEREALPLLADGSHVLWVIGHRISSAVKVTESTERVLRIHIRGGKEDG